tara:strand:- start:10799 stop:10915 length:117 start_codon:yes stop_codon:yes gene_type:complete
MPWSNHRNSGGIATPILSAKKGRNISDKGIVLGSVNAY